MEKITRVSFTIEESVLKKFDTLIQREGVPTRSEALGHLIRESLIERQWENGATVAGVITLVYDHHKTRLLDQIVAAQHDSGAVVICSQHAHLDHFNCMENIIVRGKVEKIRALHQRLSAIKGIKHVVLTMTTNGQEL